MAVCRRRITTLLGIGLSILFTTSVCVLWSRQEAEFGLWRAHNDRQEERIDRLRTENQTLHEDLGLLADSGANLRETLLARDDAFFAILHHRDEETREATQEAFDALVSRLGASEAALQASLRSVEAGATAIASGALTGTYDLWQALQDFSLPRQAPSGEPCVQLIAIREGTDAWLGSGFVVGDGVLLTAGHVVDKAEQVLALIGGERVVLRVLKFSVGPADWAVCSFDASKWTGEVYALDYEMPSYGEPVWLASNRPEIRKGPVVSPGVYIGDDGSGSRQHTAVFIGGRAGMSGAPILYRGRVVAILVTGLTNWQEFQWSGIVPLGTFRTAIEEALLAARGKGPPAK